MTAIDMIREQYPDAERIAIDEVEIDGHRTEINLGTWHDPETGERVHPPGELRMWRDDSSMRVKARVKLPTPIGEITVTIGDPEAA